MANRRALRRRRSWTGLALSVGLHAVVLGALALTRERLQPTAEPAPVDVLIVDASALRPTARPGGAETRRPKIAARRPAAAREPIVGSPSPVMAPPSEQDLFAAAFADGRRPPPPKPSRKLTCPPPPTAPEADWVRCRRDDDVAKAVTHAFDPQRRRDSEFANEARHKEAMKRYLELPGEAGYPGIGCAVFHRC